MVSMLAVWLRSICVLLTTYMVTVAAERQEQVLVRIEALRFGEYA